uniref:Uncharacterized protein n=1 Tax=Rhizophora mucronata TaxID=61149 RepID=A0A2P2R3X5_RHIMU
MRPDPRLSRKSHCRYPNQIYQTRNFKWLK